MPPGKGFYGKKYKEKRSGERRLTPVYLLAGVPVLALFAWIGMSVFGGGSDSSDPESGTPVETNDHTPAATSGPKVAPTRDPASKIAGENEGAGVVPGGAAKPNINEYLVAGGKRFSLPLTAHAGVEDYFGAARADGKTHTGVDFSVVGLKNVPVEAGCAGFVVEATTDNTHGLHVTVDCGGDFKVIVGWLSSLRVTDGNNVSKTSVVGMGEPDGFVHVEIRYKDIPVDPKDFMQIPGKEVVPWTPTPSPTPRPDDTATPEPTETPTKTAPPGSTPTPPSGGGTNSDPDPTATATLGPPTNTPTVTPTPTITPTPTRTPTPTKTPAPPKNTPTPLPQSR